jgi:hypothetical protein
VGNLPLQRYSLESKNFKTNKKQIGWEGVGCIHLAQDDGKWQILVSTVMKLWIL